MSKILIITSNTDTSATRVIKWINYLDSSVEIIRLNTDELFDKYTIRQNGMNNPIFFSYNDVHFATNEISVVWLWKWVQSVHLTTKDIDLSVNEIPSIKSNLKNELNVFSQYFIYHLKTYHCDFLNYFSINEINKLEQLQIANQIGLKTPHTFISTHLDSTDLRKMIITKPMSDGIGIHKKDSFFRTYTSRVTQNNTNQDFMVSLFQQEIKKELEIRIFYLEQNCYAIAILSQFDTQTSIDYRNYNYAHPNRFEFYSIPKELQEKIRLFMKHFNLQSGSLDFILDKQGEYFFLEVNPSGQYAPFNACNIYPDKLIAEYLLTKHYEHYSKT